MREESDLSKMHTQEAGGLNTLDLMSLVGEDHASSEKGGGINLRYLIAAVRSNLKLLALIFVVTLAVAVVVTLLMTPRYEATADIQINNTGSRLLKDQDQEGEQEVSNALDTERFLQTQVDVLNSQGMADRVSKKLNLANNARFFASQGMDLPQVGTLSGLVDYRIFKLLSKHLTVTLPHDSRVVKVTFDSTDPAMSALVANTYVDEFIQFNLQRKFDSSSYARDFLANQLVEEKRKLEESEKALNAYTRNAGLIRMSSTPGGATSSGGGNGAAGEGASVTISSLLQVNQAANEARTRRIAAEGRWNALKASNLLSATEVTTNMTIGQLLTQKATIVSQLEQDRARHLESYPTVRAGEKQLAAVNQQIQSAANNIRNAVHNDYLAALDSEKQLTAQVEHLKSETLNEQDRTVQYGLLAREADTNRQVYDGLLQRYKEINAAAGISTSNVSIIDTARAPIKPSSPDVMKNMAIGFVLALALSTLVLAIKDQLDDSIRIPEDVEAKLNMLLLGVVPHIHQDQPAELLTDPKSQLTEAFNSLRGTLMFSTPNGVPHTMLVTSAQPSEGKSTTSYATAMALARSGKRVVLIDADLRRPSQHRWIGSANDSGLSNLLTSQIAVESVAQPTAVPGLSMITSGPIPPSPTELLSGARIREVILEARQHYDVVLIDSPPILGLADAPMMAALVEGVMFVVEADRSRHGSLKGAIRRLRAVHPNILGAVLTKFDPLKSGNRYSSYYGYDYYQYQYGYRHEEA